MLGCGFCGIKEPAMKYTTLTHATTILLAALLAGAPITLAQQPASKSLMPAPAVAVKLQTPAILPYNDSKTKVALDGHLASLKTALQMSPEQKALWLPVQAVIRDINKDLYQRRKEREVTPPPAGVLDALGRIADSEERRAKDLRRFIDAAKVFAASLTGAQLERFPQFLGMIDNSGPYESTGQQLIFELLE
jgi:hypothetical protein